MKKEKEMLSVKEIKKYLSILKKNDRKPVWSLTWEFPFIKKFYVIYPEYKKIGKNIDYYVKKNI